MRGRRNNDADGSPYGPRTAQARTTEKQRHAREPLTGLALPTVGGSHLRPAVSSSLSSQILMFGLILGDSFPTQIVALLHSSSRRRGVPPSPSFRCRASMPEASSFLSRCLRLSFALGITCVHLIFGEIVSSDNLISQLGLPPNFEPRINPDAV